MAELRKDPVTGCWVIIATERSRRPKEYETLRGDVRPGICPFCFGNESLTPGEVLAFRDEGTQPNEAGWWVRVVPNKYPALSSQEDVCRRADGMYDLINGVGAHEVIIDTPDHQIPMAALPVDHIQEILWAYRLRLIHHSQDPNIEYILIFKNHGPAAGASLDHPHTQLIATPIVPLKVKEELVGAERYWEYRDRCVFCDMINQEERKPIRLLETTPQFIAIEPYASRFPFETWILPRKHQWHFEDTHESGMNELAGLLKKVLGKMWNALADPPFNFMIHVAPPGEGSWPHFHWHIEIIPKLTTPAGFEWGSGFYINPTAPEEACRYLSSAQPDVHYSAPARVLKNFRR